MAEEEKTQQKKKKPVKIKDFSTREQSSRPAREGAWWRKYTKEFLDEPEPVQAEKPPLLHSTLRPRKKIIVLQPQIGNPFSEIERIQKDMDKTFKRAFSGSFFNLPTFPRIIKLNEGVFRKSMIEVKDLGKQIAVRAEMPGVKKEDIKIRIEGKNLILDAHSSQKREKSEEGVQSFSQNFIGFRNVIRLPTEVNKKTVRAKYESGVLTVILEKKENSGASGDIEIE